MFRNVQLRYVNVAGDDDLYTCMSLCGQCVLQHEIMLKGLFTYVASV